MNIVYYSSDLFSEMCGVAIQSLCENNKDADDINIYVVEDNISDENKKRLNNIVQHFSRKIFFIKKPEQKDLYPEVTGIVVLDSNLESLCFACVDDDVSAAAGFAFAVAVVYLEAQAGKRGIERGHFLAEV